MNRILMAAVAAVMVMATGVHAADWRKNGTPEEQQANLVKLVPGASHWMIEMGERYKNLYWAARQEKWAFAAYQAEEIEKLVETLMLARPGRAESAQIFLDKVFPGLHEATASGSWDTFEPAFQILHGECMHCHVREDHEFVQIPPEPATATSPVLNMK
jgi:hypothetical protein